MSIQDLEIYLDDLCQQAHEEVMEELATIDNLCEQFNCTKEDLVRWDVV